MEPEAPTRDNDFIDTLHRIEEHLRAIRDGAGAPSRDWHTIQEIAEQLQVSRDTVERLIASGRLKAAEIRTPSGRGYRHPYRIRREWLEEFLAESLVPQCQPQRRRCSSFGKPKRDFIG